MRRKFPVVILFAAAMSACATVNRVPGVAQFDHEIFYGFDDDPVRLVVPMEGATFSTGSVDRTRYPKLADAWEAGAKPASPLIGREPALSIRELAVTPLVGTGGKVRLQAKALTPFPVRLTLLAVEDGVPSVMSQANSESWSTGSHFADLQVDYSASAGTIIIVRTEGAHQAFESWVQLEPGS
jgi:hypothetical protein